MSPRHERRSPRPSGAAKDSGGKRSSTGRIGSATGGRPAGLAAVNTGRTDGAVRAGVERNGLGPPAVLRKTIEFNPDYPE